MTTATEPRTRAELARTVALMKQHGVSDAFIAGELGISRSYVNDLLLDPDGAKGRARKESYRRPCPGYGGPCGKLMTGCNGHGPDAPTLCAECMARRNHEERRWTREACLEAGRLWLERAGEPPIAADFEPALARAEYGERGVKERRARLEELGGRDLYPSCVTIQNVFGKWSKFRELLGYPTVAGNYVRTPETKARMSATYKANYAPTRERRLRASLAQLRRLGEELDRFPTMLEYHRAHKHPAYGAATLRHNCGGVWATALWRAVHDVDDGD